MRMPNGAALSSLTAEQREQILRQVQYHVSAQPWEDVCLSRVVSLRLRISSSVTRPMSSKHLSKWLWSHNGYISGRRVLDVGTGSGVQGLTCLLAGAKHVTFNDVVPEAVECARTNFADAGLIGSTDFVVSDLLANVPSSVFDLVVFAQPFFTGSPFDEYPFTRGMLAHESFLDRFFSTVRGFLADDGLVVMMRWPFAGRGQDPVVHGRSNGFTVSDEWQCQESEGVQSGEFSVVTLRAEGPTSRSNGD
jgi:methylase of polypeptide subunit release factors